MASTPSSRTVRLIFWFLPVFVVVFIAIRLSVISFFLPMHDKYLCNSIESWLSVFLDFCWKLLTLLSVKTLKKFQKFFWTLINFKLIFLICKKFQLMNRNRFFSFNRNLIYFGYSFSNSWFIASMPQDFKKIEFLDIFVILVHVEILSYYPNIDSSLWVCTLTR